MRRYINSFLDSPSLKTILFVIHDCKQFCNRIVTVNPLLRPPGTSLFQTLLKIVSVLPYELEYKVEKLNYKKLKVI